MWSHPLSLTHKQTTVTRRAQLLRRQRAAVLENASGNACGACSRHGGCGMGKRAPVCPLPPPPHQRRVQASYTATLGWGVQVCGLVPVVMLLLFAAVDGCMYRAYGHRAAMAQTSMVVALSLRAARPCHTGVTCDGATGLCRSHSGAVVATADDFGKVRRLHVQRCLLLVRAVTCAACAGQAVQMAVHCKGRRLQAVLRPQQPRSQRALHQERPIPCASPPQPPHGWRVPSHACWPRCQLEGQTCLSCKCASPHTVAPHMSSRTRAQWRHEAFVDDKRDAFF